MNAPAGTELEVIDGWLAATLTGDPALVALLGDRGDGVDNVYAELAPPEAVAPWLIWQLQGGGNAVRVVRSGPATIMVEAPFLVKAVTASESYAALAPIVSRVDELLNGVGPASPAGGGTIVGAYLETVIRYVEPPDVAGRQWRHRGGIYRIFAQTTG